MTGVLYLVLEVDPKITISIFRLINIKRARDKINNVCVYKTRRNNDEKWDTDISNVLRQRIM